MYIDRVLLLNLLILSTGHFFLFCLTFTVCARFGRTHYYSSLNENERKEKRVMNNYRGIEKLFPKLQSSIVFLEESYRNFMNINSLIN